MPNLSESMLHEGLGGSALMEQHLPPMVSLLPQLGSQRMTLQRAIAAHMRRLVSEQRHTFCRDANCKVL